LRSNSLADRIIKPENCAIAFGIPTTVEDFERDLCHPNKDFSKIYNGVRQKYVKEFLNPLHKTEPVMTRLGVNVIHNLRLDDFGELFQKEKLEVVILFSHWKDHSVEFYDGFAEITQIVNEIPIDLSGIIDLCVCHPKELTFALRKLRPNYLVRFTDKEATPFFWLYFYLALFSHLANNELTYLDALKELIIASFKTTR